MAHIATKQSTRQQHKHQHEASKTTGGPSNSCSSGSRSNKEKPKKVHVSRMLAAGCIQPELNRFPYCIVWQPLPIVTWFVPLIGHIGVANSQGIIYDFSDDYSVSIDRFSFGEPTKYHQLDPSCMDLGQGGERSQVWDRQITEAAQYFGRTRHNLCFNNCHQLIADVLDRVKYRGRTDWNELDVFQLISCKSSYLGWWGFMHQWAPFMVLLLGAVLVVLLLWVV